MAISPKLGADAHHYMKARLMDGLALSRNTLVKLSGMTAAALVPEAIPVDRAHDFNHGGLGGEVFSEMVDFLIDRFGAMTLFLELPLWKQNDPGISECGFNLIMYEDEIYGVCRLSEPRAKVEIVLRSADPGYLYNLFISRVDPEMSISISSDEWVRAVIDGLEGFLMGAYDGEGFMMVTW